ncbi:MAG: HAD-IIA family hydrolase [Propionibacteriales bacterium]|nr:HAD-IIA family hydrolase [Propionibacteriales bacterium]
MPGEQLRHGLGVKDVVRRRRDRARVVDAGSVPQSAKRCQHQTGCARVFGHRGILVSVVGAVRGDRVPDTKPRHGSAFGSASRPLVEIYDTAIFDLDGVVYVGGEAVKGAPELIAKMRDAGVLAAYVTNNASRPPAAVAERLRRIGVHAETADVVTSAQAAARLVAARVPSRARVLVVGGDGLAAALAEQGLTPVWSVAEDPAAVVQGFHPDVGWRLLAEGTAAVESGLPWIASNLDSTLRTATGRAPGNGLLVGVIAGATGRRPVVAGKPEPALFAETMLRVGADRPLVVGDRLDTDIEGAVRSAMDSLLVMTGVTDVVTLASAPVGLRPTYASSDLRGLFEPHPAAERVPQGRRCGGWTASRGRDADDIELVGEGDVDDALRVLVSYCWDRADTTGEAPIADRVASAWRAAAA